MSFNYSITDLMNETALQQSRDAQAAREASYRGEGGRNVGDSMGKNEFLLLLATQLRYQNPLEPTSDSDFAAQLAQFSSLEQMQNMNATLASMATSQAYSLIGKLVYAEQYVNGEVSEYFGFVESVYTRNGITFAQIDGYEFGVPVAGILEVFDNSGFVTSDSFIQTSNSLIGRTVAAKVGDTVTEGVVTRLVVDGGVMYAFIDDGEEEQTVVRVSSIFDIRVTGASNAPTSVEEE